MSKELRTPVLPLRHHSAAEMQSFGICIIPTILQITLRSYEMTPGKESSSRIKSWTHLAPTHMTLSIGLLKLLVGSTLVNLVLPYHTVLVIVAKLRSTVLEMGERWADTSSPITWTLLETFFAFNIVVMTQLNPVGLDDTNTEKRVKFNLTYSATDSVPQRLGPARKNAATMEMTD
jgi:hypothetical protein